MHLTCKQCTQCQDGDQPLRLRPTCTAAAALEWCGVHASRRRAQNTRRTDIGRVATHCHHEHLERAGQQEPGFSRLQLPGQGHLLCTGASSCTGLWRAPGDSRLTGSMHDRQAVRALDRAVQRLALQVGGPVALACLAPTPHHFQGWAQRPLR